MATKTEMLTVSQICEQLDVARGTFDKWMKKGAVPKHWRLPNGQLRFDARDVADWIDTLLVSK